MVTWSSYEMVVVRVVEVVVIAGVAAAVVVRVVEVLAVVVVVIIIIINGNFYSATNYPFMGSLAVLYNNIKT